MYYQNERTQGCRISDAWTFRGLRTVIIENESIRILIIADKGADISSFVYKPTDTEFMFRTPWGIRNPKLTTPPTGDPASVWLDYYEGGWQSVLPYGGYPGKYYGADFGIHGDVNTVPWDIRITNDSPEKCEVEFLGRSVRSPFEIRKTVSIISGQSFINVKQVVNNLAEQDLDMVWLEHIAIGGSFLSDECSLSLPKCDVLSHPEDIDPSSKLTPNFKGPWPYVPLKDGSTSDFRNIPGKSDRSLDMAYMTNFEDGWYAVTNSSNKLTWGVEFPKEIFKYLWYWRNFGGGYGYPWYGRCYNAGLEPCTSWDNVGYEQAKKNGTTLPVKAGQTITANIRAGVFTDYLPKNKKNPFT